MAPLSPELLAKWTQELKQAIEIKESNRHERTRRRGKHADLRRLRTGLRLTQRDMAEALRVSVRTVEGWESGKRIPESILLLTELIHELPSVRRYVLPRIFWE